MGSNSKQQQIQNMQQLIAIGGQLTQLGVPVLDQANASKMFEEIIRNMGYKDIEQFMPAPQKPKPPQGGGGSNFPSTGNNINSLNQLAAGSTAATEAIPGGAQAGTVAPTEG